MGGKFMFKKYGADENESIQGIINLPFCKLCKNISILNITLNA